ncbi:MAG: hypothetical protein KIT27_04185 [Legionellales bacterium]|nr:hypothetical protein [Legionellales bacterium]
MKSGILSIFIISLLAMTVITYASVDPKSPWQIMAYHDLAITRERLLSSVPKTEDKNTHYGYWLQAGYEKVLAMVPKINSFSGYIYALRFYLNGFRDYHTEVVPLLKIINPSEKWPGFIIGKRDGQIKVVYRDTTSNFKQTLPAVGATLISCDETPVEKLIEKQLLPYYPMQKDDPATWSEYIPQLLIWDQNPFINQLKKCTFLDDDHTKIYHLSWQVVRNPSPLSLGKLDFPEKIDDAAFGKVPKFTITKFKENSVWISIPIFAWGLPTDGRTSDQWLTKIADQISQFRKAKLLVFDLRGNTGGDPIYMEPIITHLYTKNYLRSLGKRFDWNQVQKINFFASKNNLQHFIETKSPNSMIEGMSKAIKEHQKSFIYQNQILSPGSKSQVNPVSAKVILLTDGRCASECNSFVLAMKSIPGVIQVGRATAPVTNSTWNTVYVFKDNVAAIVYPLGQIQSPKMADGKALHPIFEYEGDMGDTGALQQWIWHLYQAGKLNSFVTQQG